MITVEKFTQVFSRSLCHSVDVFGNGCGVFSHPHRGRVGGRREGATKSAGRAGEDKGSHTGRPGLFQKNERARNVGVNEALPVVGEYMRFMQGCGMKDPLYPFHASPDKIPVGDGPDFVREVGMNKIETDGLVASVL